MAKSSTYMFIEIQGSISAHYIHYHVIARGYFKVVCSSMQQQTSYVWVNATECHGTLTTCMHQYAFVRLACCRHQALLFYTNCYNSVSVLLANLVLYNRSHCGRTHFLVTPEKSESVSGKLLCVRVHFTKSSVLFGHVKFGQIIHLLIFFADIVNNK